MQGYYNRVNIDVECIINAHGKIHLIAMHWKEQRFEISDYKFRMIAQNNTGKSCNLYICKIDGVEKNIYFDNEAFFVEVSR